MSKENEKFIAVVTIPEGIAIVEDKTEEGARQQVSHVFERSPLARYVDGLEDRVVFVKGERLPFKKQ